VFLKDIDILLSFIVFYKHPIPGSAPVASHIHATPIAPTAASAPMAIRPDTFNITAARDAALNSSPEGTKNASTSNSGYTDFIPLFFSRQT
jgi:hypothetical protein